MPRHIPAATPLSTSTLLTRDRSEPALGHELACELATADRVDAIVAFVEALDRLARRRSNAEVTMPAKT